MTRRPPVEELDVRSTPLGELVLRRRHSPVLDADLHEILLAGEYLMSSAVHASEVALATIGLEGTESLGGPVLVGGQFYLSFSFFLWQ